MNSFKSFTKAIVFLIFFFISALTGYSQQLAFPGAEGFGKFATGGRTGTVYHVTNLDDSGAGSLRDAVSKSNRIVVFDVGGVIVLNSGLIVKSNIYLAGQTAPGEGITVYGNRVSFSGADNSICRYMKFRMGEKYGDSGKDACGIANGRNMIFDHCSISWGRDETFSINWDGNGTEPANISIQNCIIAQGLMSHSAGGLIQTNGGVSLYRNFYVDNDTRNNKIKGVNQFVNNLVYNWRSAAYIMGGASEGLSYANCVGNYFIKGPDDGSTPLSGANSNFNIYADDNWYDSNKDGVLNGYEVPFSEYSGGPTFMTNAFDYPELPTIEASSLFDNILPEVGASLPCRDYLDYYVISEVKSLGGIGEIITSEDEMPFGSPDSWNLWTGSSRADSDGDGIPDSWEGANALNSSLNDAMEIASNGYSNIENYINSIDKTNTQPYLRTPLNLVKESATQNSISLAWFDYTEDEEGYIIERNIDGVYTEIGRTGVNVSTFKVEGLVPEESGTYRVKAFNSDMESGYSNAITCKSKPVPVEVLDLGTFNPELIWTGTNDENWNKSTQNWTTGSEEGLFTDDSKVLFGNLSSPQEISISETVSPMAMVVFADNDYSFSGSSISGTGSVNKAGSGTLKLLSSNTYTGATVIHEGELQINSLANGGVESSIGASQNYDFNFVWKGGMINYTGASASTDRNVALDENTQIGISQPGTILTMTGSIAGEGGLTKSGAGSLKLTNENPYAGTTTINEGYLELNGLTALEGAGMGTSGQIIMKGGGLKLTGGNGSNYESYTFDMDVVQGTTNSFQVDKTCYIKGKVSGQGTLDYNIYYVREYIQGDWSQFSGTLNAKGMGTTSDGNQLMLNNSNGIPNGRIVTSGSLKIICWKNASTMRLGGLSGSSGTYLAGADKQNNSATMTWIVGGAGTDETFNGIINNECSKYQYKGTTSIVKEGGGIWRLTGSNIYSGTTKVKGGKLIVNGTHTGTGTITVDEGGTLAGKGQLNGSVIINSNGIIEPGDNTVSTLTIAKLTLNEESISAFDVDIVSEINDVIASTGSITYNGTLQLNVRGIFEEGDKMTLFTGSSHAGSFTKIIPEIPGEGLLWEFSDGILSVAKSNAVEEFSDRLFTVYPNPVKDIAHFLLDNSYAEVNVMLREVSGKAIITQQFSNERELKMDLSHLSPGFYIAEIVADNKILGKIKLLKE